jgi:hypothetical protein
MDAVERLGCLPASTGMRRLAALRRSDPLDLPEIGAAVISFKAFVQLFVTHHTLLLLEI